MKNHETAAWRESMRLKINYNNMMKSALIPDGFTADEIKALPLDDAFKAMTDKRPQLKWRELPHNQEEIVARIEETAAWVRREAEAFVVLGIGGSALGPIAVHQALRHLNYNELPKEKRGGPKLYVLDNVDPERFAALLDVIDLKKTVFNVITKSGSTSETMSQLLIAVDLLKKTVGEDISRHLIATTDKEKGNLIKIARQENLTTFIVPDGVGGRFSELCPVGLLAAAVCGIDIRELLSGAAYMDELTQNTTLLQNPAVVLGALQKVAMDRGMNIHVMMPYADSLKYISDWYAQLWAESLGKNVTKKGMAIRFRESDVRATGRNGMGVYGMLENDAFIARLAELAGKARYVLSVCNGAFLYARAGVLDDRRATTYKARMDRAEELFPSVNWERSSRWTVDGNLFVSSGVSAGTDMALGFIAEVCGREVAEKTARYAEYTWNDDPANDPFAC